MNEIYIVINVLFVQNLALSYGIGLLPVVRKAQAFTFTWSDFAHCILPIFLAGCAGWGLNRLLSDLLHLEFLRTLVFSLCLIGIIQVLRSIGGPRQKSRYLLLTQPLGAASVLIAIMALAGNSSLGFPEALLLSLGASLGYVLAIAIHAGLLSRIELDWLPKAFRGLPITLMGLGLASLAFLAVSSVLAKAIGGGQ